MFCAIKRLGEFCTVNLLQKLENLRVNMNVSLDHAVYLFLDFTLLYTLLQGVFEAHVLREHHHNKFPPLSTLCGAAFYATVQKEVNTCSNGQFCFRLCSSLFIL